MPVCQQDVDCLPIRPMHQGFIRLRFVARLCLSSVEKHFNMHHIIKTCLASAALCALASCATTGVMGPQVSDARKLHDDLLTLDTHLDTPRLLEQADFDITSRYDAMKDFSQVDLPRMREGGLDGGFWVIYTPQGPRTVEGYQNARNKALLRAVAIHKMAALHSDEFKIATTSTDAERIVADGKIIAYMSIENSYPLGEDISLLKTFYDLGVRMAGPVHGTNNQFSDSSTDKALEWDGLSPLGEALVEEMNRLGIIVDGSHAHDLAFDDMLALSKTPLILSHSGAKDVYDHPRNIDDARLLKLAASGGVIQMNALGTYLTKLNTSPERGKAYGALFRSLAGQDRSDPDVNARFLKKRREIDALYPADMAQFEDYMRHFLHVLELIGPNHVGIGADWDGGGGVAGMNDVADVDKITERLLEEGYSREDLEKIWSGNVLRLLKAAEDYAALQN